MRLYVFILLFILTLAAPFVLRATLSGPADRAGATAASGAAQVERLVVATPHNQDIRREFARAFDAWHRAKYGTGVAIDYRAAGGTNDIKRQLETTYGLYRDARGVLKPPVQVMADIDVVFGGGDYFFNRELKGDLGILQPMPLSPALLKQVFPRATLAGVKLYDQEQDAAGRALPPQWVGVCLSSFGIVYNPDLYQRLGLPAPTQWRDLTDEKLNGLLALADPTHSGSAAVAYQMVLQRAMADAEEAYIASLPPRANAAPAPVNQKDPRYEQAIDAGWRKGMGELLLMAANARYFTDSATLVPSDVGDGQAAAGIAIDFYGRVYQESVGAHRCSFVLPRAATAITPDPVAILYGVKGRRFELAMHFVEFLLSKPGQELWITRPGYPNGPRQRALRRMPIRADLYGPGVDHSGWTDAVNPFAAAGTFNQRGQWMALFTDTRPIWAAAWIDAGDALKESWTMILAVPDPHRRAELVAALAQVPITRQEVRRQMQQRIRLQSTGGDVDQWKAMQRIKWANTFRRHYEAVASMAAR